MVQDFADLCYHSYHVHLKELQESTSEEDLHPLRYFIINLLS